MGLEAAALEMLIGAVVVVASIAWRIIRFLASTLHLWPTVIVWVIWEIGTEELGWTLELATAVAVLLTIANIIYSIWRAVMVHRARKNMVQTD